MEDNGSCGSRVVESTPANTWQQRRKVEVYNEVLRRLKDSSNQEVQLHGFDDQLWAHFNRLPTRYLQSLMGTCQGLFNQDLQIRLPHRVSTHHLPLALLLTSKRLFLKQANHMLQMRTMLLTILKNSPGPCMKLHFQLVTSQNFSVS